MKNFLQTSEGMPFGKENNNNASSPRRRTDQKEKL